MKRWDVVERLIRTFTLDGVGVEVGVKEAKFSSHLLATFKPLTMFGVDTYRSYAQSDAVGHETYAKWHWLDIIATMRKNTARFGDRWRLMVMDSECAAELIADATVDFVFIDAQHDYDSVVRDIRAWRGKIRRGGLLCGHDYNPGHVRLGDVSKAVDDMVRDVRVENDTVWWSRICE